MHFSKMLLQQRFMPYFFTVIFFPKLRKRRGGIYYPSLKSMYLRSFLHQPLERSVQISLVSDFFFQEPCSFTIAMIYRLLDRAFRLMILISLHRLNLPKHYVLHTFRNTSFSRRNHSYILLKNCLKELSLNLKLFSHLLSCLKLLSPLIFHHSQIAFMHKHTRLSFSYVYSFFRMQTN